MNGTVKHKNMRQSDSLDTVNLIWGGIIVLWALVARIFIFMNLFLFLVHTFSSLQLPIFYSELIHQLQCPVHMRAPCLRQKFGWELLFLGERGERFLP